MLLYISSTFTNYLVIEAES